MKKILTLFIVVFSLVGCQSTAKVETKTCSHLIDVDMMYRLFEYTFNVGESVETFELKLTYQPKSGTDTVQNRISFMEGTYKEVYEDIEGVELSSSIEEDILTIVVKFDLTNETAAKTLRETGLFKEGDFISSTDLEKDLYFFDGCEE